MTWANKLAFFLICAVIVFTAVAYGTVHQPTIAIFYIIVSAILTFWAIDGFISGEIKFSRSLLQIPLFALFVYGMIQIIPFGVLSENFGLSDISRTLSLDPYSTQTTSFHILSLAIFLSAISAFTNSAKRVQKIVSVITIFGFIFAFFAILQSVLSPNKIYGIYESRFASPFGSFVNRHNFAAYMEMTLSLPLGLLFVGGIAKDKRLLYFTAIALMGAALLLSGSRGGLIAFLAEIIFLIFLTTETKSYNQIALKVVLSLVLIGAVIGGSIFVGGDSSLTRLAETANSENFTTDRSQIWLISVQIIKNYPIFGAGIGGFGVAFTQFDTGSGMQRAEQAHNDYLQVLTDAGIVGLIIGVFFLFQLFKTGWKNTKTENIFRRGVVVGAFSGCFAILVHSVFDFVLHTTAISVLFLTLVSLVVSGGTDYADDFEDFQVRKHKKRRSATVTPIEEVRKRKEIEN